MYYVWQKNRQLIGEYAHFDKEPLGYQISMWVHAEKIKTDLLPMELVINEEIDSTKLSDLLFTRFDLQVFSPKLIQVFADLGVDNLDYYDTRIISHSDGSINKDYKAVNILTKIDCLDKANSECDYFDEDSDLMDVTKFQIFEHKIKPLRENDAAPLIFRLGEFPFIILVEESVRIRCEAENITGVKFVEPSRYTGY